MRKPILQSERKHVRAVAVTRMFKAVGADYAWDGGDVMNEDPARVSALKRIISRLPYVDRTIIILYCELQSTQELGRILHVSKRTAARAVARIRAEIVAKYNQMSR